MGVPLPAMQLFGEHKCDVCGSTSECNFTFGGVVRCVKCECDRIEKQIDILANLRALCVVAAVVVLFVILALMCGCKQSVPSPLPQWSIKQIRPDGTVQKRWTVRANDRPLVNTDWGGASFLYKRNVNARKRRFKDIYAPTGWSLEVERVTNE